MDESGELGFDKNSSKYFIITLLVSEEDELIKIRRIIKRVRVIIKKEIFTKEADVESNGP
jgi:hypothetical protein